ncbi:MAG: hypothetical protein KGI38_00465 [Thaumarchaeota archaeon]|nr:hypothetical protein [Nitrososphaerota archaeon]
MIGYLIIRRRNARIARRVLYVGGAFTIVYLVAYAGTGYSIGGGSFLTFQSGVQRTNPDGGTALYIEHIRFANGTITVIIQNYANGNSQLGRILVDNTTGSQVFDPSTAVYALYANPCDQSGPCGSGTASAHGFQLAGYVYANNTKVILTPNTQYYSLTVGPYPSETTVTLPYHYVAGYRYWIVLQDPNNNNYDIAYNIPSSTASGVSTVQTVTSGTITSSGVTITGVSFLSQGSVQFTLWNYNPTFANINYIVVYDGHTFYYYARPCPGGVVANCGTNPNQGSWTFELAFYIQSNGTTVRPTADVFVATTFNPDAGPGYVSVSFNWQPNTSYVVFQALNATTAIPSTSMTVSSPG